MFNRALISTTVFNGAVQQYSFSAATMHIMRSIQKKFQFGPITQKTKTSKQCHNSNVPVSVILLFWQFIDAEPEEICNRFQAFLTEQQEHFKEHIMVQNINCNFISINWRICGTYTVVPHI